MEEKNYITPKGFKALQDEFNELMRVERPKIVETVSWAAGNGDRSENGDYIYGKKRLREIDSRLRFLSKRIDAAEVIDPVSVVADRVKFGATVTILTEDDQQKTFAIVGVDETDPAAGKISWKSPLAKALLNAKAGDLVTYQAPAGEIGIELLQMVYIEVA